MGFESVDQEVFVLQQLNRVLHLHRLAIDLELTQKLLLNCLLSFLKTQHRFIRPYLALQVLNAFVSIFIGGTDYKPLDVVLVLDFFHSFALVQMPHTAVNRAIPFRKETTQSALLI